MNQNRSVAFLSFGSTWTVEGTKLDLVTWFLYFFSFKIRSLVLDQKKKKKLLPTLILPYIFEVFFNGHGDISHQQCGCADNDLVIAASNCSKISSFSSLHGKFFALSLSHLSLGVIFSSSDVELRTGTSFYWIVWLKPFPIYISSIYVSKLESPGNLSLSWRR